MLIASYSLWRFQSWIYILFRVYQRKHTIGVWERKTTNIFNMAELFKTACTTIHQGIRKLNFHTHWFPHSGFQYNGWGFLWFSLFALPYLCNVFVYWFWAFSDSVLFVFPWLCLYHICMWRLFTSYILWRAMIGSITHTFSLYWLSDYPKHISFPNFMSFSVIIFWFFEDWILSEFVGETLLEKQKNLWFPSLVTGTSNSEACWTYSETFPLRNCLFCLLPPVPII